MVKEVGVVALAEHLRGEEEHRGKRDSHEGTALEKRADDLHGLALLAGSGLGGNALFRPGVAEHVGQDGEQRDHDDADQDLLVIHLAAAVGELDVADGDQDHRRHCAEGGADRAEHAQRAALLVAGGDDLRQGAVRNVNAGVEHAEEDVGDVDPGQFSAAGEAGDPDEHQDRRQRHGNGEDFQPVAVAPVGTGLGPVDQTAPDRVVDRVPDAGDDRHDHHAQHADLQKIGVVLVHDALRQTEDQAGGKVAHRVTDLVPGFDAAGAGDVGSVHVSSSLVCC